MGLSRELISQFVKITNDSKKKKPKETIVYGTVKASNDKMYVKLDGSSLLTPIIATTTIREDDRVTVMIKNHSAVVTGNLSSPSASNKELLNLASDLGILDGDISDALDKIDGDIGNITNSFDLLVKTVSEINDDLVETGQDVVSNTGKITTNTNDISGLKTRVGTNETNITSLKNLTSGIKKSSSGNYTLNGFEFGTNKILWSGASVMMNTDTITLSETVSKQDSGIVLVFSAFDQANGTVHNADFNIFFLPKHTVTSFPGSGHSFLITSGSDFWKLGCKYLYIYDDKIVGYEKNNVGGTSSTGILFDDAYYVLRYVIGV